MILYFLFRLFIFLITFELFLNLLIKFLKFKKIPWIITNTDENPVFNKKKLIHFSNQLTIKNWVGIGNQNNLTKKKFSLKITKSNLGNMEKE